MFASVTKSFQKSCKKHLLAEAYICYDNMCVLNPVGKCRIFWDLFVAILLVYTCIEIPFTLAFNIELTLEIDDWVGITAFIIDILLLLDIFINCSTAYFDDYDGLYLITSPCEICKRYCVGGSCCNCCGRKCCCSGFPHGWLIIDFITSFPFEFIIPQNQQIGTFIKAYRILRGLRIIKLVRLIKMMRSLNDLVQRLLLQRLVLFLRLCKCLLIIVIFAHYCACLWYYIGDHCYYHGKDDMCNNSSWLDGYFGFEFEESTLWQRYTVSFYWSVVTLMTTGYGDITATNMCEQWVASGCILIGTCFFAYFIGAVSGLIVNGDNEKSEIRSKLEKAKKFCQVKKLPPHLSFAIIAHTKYHLQHNFGYDETMDILNNLPKHLKCRVTAHMGTKMLSQFELFDELDYETIGLISLKMRYISCNQGYTIFNKNEIGSEIYIQRSGESLLCDGSGNRMDKFERGDVFGEESMILNSKRNYSVKCNTWCEFYVINCHDIREIIKKQYPKTFQVKFLVHNLLNISDWIVI